MQAPTCRVSSPARPTGSVGGGTGRGAARARPAGVEPEGFRSTGGLAVGGVGWCEPLGAVGRTIAVDRLRAARGGRRWQRQAELARSGLRRLLPWLALGRRRPLTGHVVRVSHASLLPQPRTARANRRQDAGGAVTVTTLHSCLARCTASGHGRSFAGEGWPAQDSGPVVHAGPRLAQRQLGSAVLANHVGLRPPVLRPDGVCAARRTHRPLWTGSRRREWSGRRPAERRFGVRSIRRRPRRRGAQRVHSGLTRFLALEMGQPLVVGQLPPARRGIVRRPPAHDLRQLVRRRLAAVVAPCGRRRHLRTQEPTSLRAAVRRRRPTPLRNLVPAAGPMPRRRRRGPGRRGPTRGSHPRRRGPVGTRPPGLTTVGFGPRICLRNTRARRSRLPSLVGDLGPVACRRHGARGVRLIGAGRLAGSGGGGRLGMRIRPPTGGFGLGRPALRGAGLAGPDPAVDRVDRRAPQLLLGLGGRGPGIGGPRRLRLARNDRVPAVDGGRGRGTTVVGRLSEPRRRRLGRRDVLRTVRFAGRRQPQPVLLGVPARECVGEPARTLAVVVGRMLTSAHPGSLPSSATGAPPLQAVQPR